MSSKSEERKLAIKGGGQSPINKSHQQKSRNRAWIGDVCVFVIGLMLIAGIFYLSKNPPSEDWVGMAKSEEESQKIIEKVNGKSTEIITIKKIEQSKTLWDWLSLLGVPITLLILGYLLQRMQQKRTDDLSNEQRKLAASVTNEEALQVYFDRLSELLVDKNLRAIANNINSEEQEKSQTTPEEQELLASAVDVIRARTLSILRRFENDEERKTSVIRFLIEADFISKLNLDLSGADLSGAILNGANLSGAILNGANLSGANLSLANLSGAILIGADLSNAILISTNLSNANLSSNNTNLSGADLRHANLSWAKLFVANLSGADLSGANLSRADFNGANLREVTLKGADLSWATLSEAKGLLDEQIKSADKWENATCNGKRLDNAEVRKQLVLNTDP
jgi:uncharacterized protein YjbI with pentapeptide repeats